VPENATPHPAPAITAAELPYPALAAGRYRGGRLVHVIHADYLVPSTVEWLVQRLQASTGRPDSDQVLALGDAR
jgi:hypothetical protein